MIQVFNNNIVEWLRKKKIEPYVDSSSSFKQENHPDDEYGPKKALIYDTNSYFFSEIKANQWWSIDFTRKVMIAGYEVRSKCQDSWIYNWDAQIKDENSDWITIDTHRNTCGKNFSLSEIYNTRFFRIYGMGRAVQNTDAIAFYFIRFFGNVMSQCYTANNRNRAMNNNLIVLMISLISN